MNKPKQASQISINAHRQERKLADKNKRDTDELIAMEKKRMLWFDYLCINASLPR